MDNDAVNFVVQDLQWPQAKSAIATGLALGLAGTLFQQLLRNPLASPDFVGISSGASVAAVAGIVIYDFGGLGIPALAVIGAVVSSVLMYVLAWKDGINGYRFILIGIGVSTFMYGLVGYLLTHSRLEEAREAMHWLIGSVGQSGNTEVNLLLVALAVLVPLSLVLRRLLRSLELGDDTARVLGTQAEAARLVLIAVAVVLTGLATAVAGPLIFVALVAGPIADRLLGPAAGGLLAAASVGAALVLASDYVAVNLLPTAAAHRGGHRCGRGAVPAVAPGHHQQREHVHDRSDCLRADLSLGYAERDVVDGTRRRHPRRAADRHRRRERLRQVHPAARHGPAAQAAVAARCCSTAPR